MQSLTDIHYETDGGIATITMDRPESYNAFTWDTILELNETIRHAHGDDGVYVLVLTGGGDGFCTGADLNDIVGWDDMTNEEYAGFLWGVQNVVRQLRSMAKPSIAAVNGPAIGAGSDFALACDVRFMAEDAFLCEGFVRVGLISGDGGGWLLPRLIGEAKAKEYLLTGEDIDAEEAVDVGLARAAVENPLGATYEFAEQLLDLPARAVQHTNRLINPERSFEAYCERAIKYQWDCINDLEHREAVTAMREDREPRYEREYV